MKLSNLMVGVGIALSLVLGFLGFNKPATVVVQKETVALGGSADVQSPYIRYGGVSNYAYQSQSLLAGTTTVCSITSPAATSTLVFASLQLNTSSSSALAVDISKGAGPGSTGSSTSRFNGTGLITVAGNRYTAVASSTGLGAGLDTFAPNTPLNFTLDNGTGFGNLAPVGACQAQFVTHI